jgi:hypothetical protein
MKDQADTLRKLMVTREKARRNTSDPAISIFLTPEVRKSRLFSPRELALFARAKASTFRIRDESDPISANGGNPKILGRLCVLTGNELDIAAAYKQVKNLARDRGVKKLDILVCVPAEGVEGDSQARRIFTQFFEVCRRFLDIDLNYLGSFSRGEKMRDSLAVSKFLLHYESGPREVPKAAGSLIGG